MDNIIQSKRELQNNKAPSLLPDNLNKTRRAVTKVKRSTNTIQQTPFSKRMGGPIGLSRDPPKRQTREIGGQKLYIVDDILNSPWDNGPSLLY